MKRKGEERRKGQGRVGKERKGEKERKREMVEWKDKKHKKRRGEERKVKEMEWNGKIRRPNIFLRHKLCHFCPK